MQARRFDRSFSVGLLISFLAAGCGGAAVMNDGATTEVGDMAGSIPPVIHGVDGVTVSTLAGSGTAGAQEGTGGSARFDNPVGVALVGASDLFITEYDGGRIRRLTRAGVTSPLTAQAGFVGCFGIMAAASDRLLVETDFDATGKKTATSGTLWNVALGSGAATQLVTGMGRPRGLVPASGGQTWVTDSRSHTISMMSASNGQLTRIAGAADIPGYVDGNGGSARFNTPLGATQLSDGSLIVADSANHCLRRVASDGSVTTFAGSSAAGMVDGAAADARFDRPIAVASDTAGNVYVSDAGSNHRIRRVTAAGQVATLAGNGTAGFADGAGADAELYGQEGLAWEHTSEGDVLYIADGNGGDGSNYHRVRKLIIP